MKKHILKAVFLAFILITTFSCKKADSTVQDALSLQSAEAALKPKNHTWYYFTDQTFKEVDKIQHVPSKALSPWTEAVRISSANNASASPLSDEDVNKAYAVVNRLGILCFEGENISISLDKTIFDDRTAGNLVFLNNTPVFSIYKSAFFNDTITEDLYKTGLSDHLFLMQFDDKAKISYPIVNCNGLVEEPNSEVVDFVWDGINWLCSIKSLTEEKIVFSYINWKPTVPLLTLSPANVRNSIVIEESDVDAFRAAKEHLPYSAAPERIRKMLTGFSDDLPFIMEVKSEGGSSNKIYENYAGGGSAASSSTAGGTLGGAERGSGTGASASSQKQKPLNSKAVLSQSWSCVLFEDGTIFIEGALPGKHILRGGKPIAIKLPKLPAGFVYSDFVISNTTLYAAWEETRFYNTGRSGFVKVDLEKTLYSKLL